MTRPKEEGIASRRSLWDLQDWSQFDVVIARNLGVTPKAATYQRRKRGIPSFPRGGNLAGWENPFARRNDDE